MKRVQRILRLSPTRIAIGYLVFGGLWITLSDRLLVAMIASPTARSQIQTAKGWLFVLLSTALIYGLIRTQEGQLRASQARLVQRASELRLLHRVFRHNIRNDLNVILGHVSLVREALDDESARGQLETAYRTAERIVDMSEKLQVIDRSNVDQAPDATIDVVEVVRRELERLCAEAPLATVEADLPETAMVYGTDSLGYAIRELLVNAVEHFDDSPGACRIEVAVERSMTTVSVRVSDNGPGIPAPELRALDDDTGDPLVHTSGIGLWLVVWLCGLADAGVEFDVPPAGGTTVTITFTRAVSIEELSDQARRSVTG